MAITESSIRTFVNSVLQENFAVNAIDTEIIACLRDLSKFNLLTADPDSQAKVAGDTTLTVPSDFKKIISITPTDSGSVQRAPLDVLPGGFEQYKLLLTNFGESLRSGPTAYVRKSGSFFIYPTLDGSFSFAIDYYKLHPKSTATIEFSEIDFEDAVNFGAAYYTALFRKKTSYISIWRPIYQEERQLMIMTHLPQPSIVQG